MRADGVVVVDVLGQDASKVTLAEDDHVIEALSSDGADHTLGDGIRLGSSERRDDRHDAETAQPQIEVTAKAGVSVAYQVAGLLSPGRRSDDLTPDPLGGGMAGDVPMLDLSAFVTNHEEYIEGPEGERLYGEEVAGPDLAGMQAKEGLPRW